jgi:hypothetical protein
MNNIEVYAIAVQKAISGIDPHGVTSWEDPTFGSVASAIVEPLIDNEEAEDEYFDFLENNSENWYQWIRQTFGEDWGKVAKVVAEEGY